MKKVAIALFLLLTLSIPTYCEIHQIGTIKTYENIEFDFYYSDNENGLKIFWQNKRLYSFLIKLEDRKQLYGIFDKFLSWNKKALEGKYNFTKDIGHIDTLRSGFYSSGNEEWFSGRSGENTLFFVFQTLGKSNYLKISSDKIQASNNEYISDEPKDVYLTVKDVQKILPIISESNITKVISKNEQQGKTIDSEFK